MPEGEFGFIERLPGPPIFFSDAEPEEPQARLQWRAWMTAGMEGWAREFLRQRLGNQQTVRRFLAMPENVEPVKAEKREPTAEEKKYHLPLEQVGLKGPAENLYEAWLAGGHKSLEAQYDRMYPQPAKTQK